MRYIIALLVVVAFSVRARTASAQPQPQQIRVPYEVCAGTTQSQLCEALALLRQQQAASTVVAVAPLGAPPAVAAPVRPPPRCPSGSAGAECRCHNRGRIFQEGRCLSARTAITAVTGETRTLATRMTAAEAAIEQLRTSQATTDRRVSENTAGLNCLEVILLPNVGVDPMLARQRANEEHAAALGRTHGAYCADFYRVAYGLPTPPATTQVVTAPPTPPAPPPAPAPSAGAHASAPTADGPITVTFQ